MLSPEEEKYIFNRAYLPEHVLNLMIPVSEGDPSLTNGYLYFSKDNWMIFIGYPLGCGFTTQGLEDALNSAIKRHAPSKIWLIAPELPVSVSESCISRQSDLYYRLDIGGLEVRRDLMRAVRKAARGLRVIRGKNVSKEHEQLISEFIERERPQTMIKNLFFSMSRYVSASESSVVLSAFDDRGCLTAFYVVDSGSAVFATYVIGCYSKKNYAPHASDLLFFEMINLAKESGKSYINLGLGVNKGIRNFKEKWGGVPFMGYEFCEYKPSGRRINIISELLRGIESRP